MGRYFRKFITQNEFGWLAMTLTVWLSISTKSISRWFESMNGTVWGCLGTQKLRKPERLAKCFLVSFRGNG